MDILAERCLAKGRSSVVESADGGRIATHVAGTGPTVVIAHGYLDEHANFCAIANRLVASGRRVVLFDQRCHGASTPGRDGVSTRAMAADYAAVLEHHDVRDGVLVGHSMGGFLATAFALLHRDVAAERLRGLVLASTHAGDVTRRSIQNRVQIKLIEAGGMRLLARSKAATRVMARTLFGEEARQEWLVMAAEQVLRHDFRQTLPILRAMVDESYYGRLGDVPVPAMVVCGDRDRTCPPHHSEELGAKIRGARNVWLPGVGHMVHFEKPAAIVDAADAMLEAS